MSNMISSFKEGYRTVMGNDTFHIGIHFSVSLESNEMTAKGCILKNWLVSPDHSPVFEGTPMACKLMMQLLVAEYEKSVLLERSEKLKQLIAK